MKHLRGHYFCGQINVVVREIIFIIFICSMPQILIAQDSVANAYTNNANQLFEQKKYKQAASEFNNAIERKKIIHNKVLHTEFVGLSLTYLERGKIDSALILMDSAVYYKNLLSEDTIITSIENNLARIHLEKGNFDTALEHFMLALKNATKEKDTLNLIYLRTNIGTLYQRMLKDELALKYYLEAYRISKLSKNDEGMSMAYSIGIYYARNGEYNKAMEYYAYSIPYCKKLGKIGDLINIYSNMSNVYMLENRYDEAIKVLHKSINLSIINNKKRQLGIAYANIGKAMELAGQNDSSIFYLKKSIAVVNKLGTLNLLSKIYELTSEAYKSNNDFKNSLIYYKKHKQLSDSILDIQVMSKIASLEKKYQTEKTQKENIILKSDVEIQKRKSSYYKTLTIVFLLLGIVSLVLFYFIRRNAISKKKLAESESKMLAAKVDSQNRELSMSALSLSKNIDFINSLIVEIKDLSTHVSEDGINTLNCITKKLTQKHSDSAWKEFEIRFSEVHKDFYSKLNNKYPNLSQNEIKLCAFLKLGMNTKEICSITFQSVRAVETARLRLRKKLELNREDNLNQFLQTL